MKTIYLLSCCKEKLPYASPAKKLYQSTGFKKSLRYALSKRPDAIYILSAKHHVVSLNEVIEPYDENLSWKPESQQKSWAEICISELKSRFNLKDDKFVILCGEDYYKNLIGQNRIENYEIPLNGKTAGSCLSWFDANTSNQKTKTASNSWKL